MTTPKPTATAGEPVAWLVVNRDGDWARDQQFVYLTREATEDGVSVCNSNWPANAPHRCVPLYTHPAPPPAPPGYVMVLEPAAGEAPVPAEGAGGEPVAWRYRSPKSDWVYADGEYAGDEAASAQRQGWDVEPLYAKQA